jgi:hypothetical protein
MSEYRRAYYARVALQALWADPHSNPIAIERARAETALAEQAVGGRVYRIPAENLPVLTRQIDTLARRAEKLELAPVSMTEVAIDYEERGTPACVYEYRLVQITGPAPRLGGWIFVAVLEHDQDSEGKAQAIIHRVPRLTDEMTHEPDLSAYRHVGPYCDHCQVSRRRNDTYVVQHDDETLRQVGSSCLRDFTGHESPEVYARFAERLVDMIAVAEEQEESDGSNVPWLVRTDDYLAFVARSIRTEGWKPRSRAEYGEATADLAHKGLQAAMRATISERRDIPEIEDIELANRTLAWVRDELVPTDDSDYEHNLKIACDGDYISKRRMGLAASSITAYQRHYERAQREGAAQDAGHLAQPDDCVVVVVTVTEARGCSSAYGPATIIKMVDTEGHRLTWFASQDNKNAAKLRARGKCPLRVTVKQHKEFKGIPETIVTRCQVMD